jgi:hypothetical protein
MTQALLYTAPDSIALHMKLWTPEEESERLKTRFVGLNRAEFARDHKVPGGASMIYQHIQGMRPINLDHAIAYARGFGVPLAEISPRLAKQAMEALGITEPRTSREKPAAAAEDKFALLHQLPANCQEAILTLASAMLARERPGKRKEPAHNH